MIWAFISLIFKNINMKMEYTLNKQKKKEKKTSLQTHFIPSNLCVKCRSSDNIIM